MTAILTYSNRAVQIRVGLELAEKVGAEKWVQALLHKLFEYPLNGAPNLFTPTPHPWKTLPGAGAA